MGVDRISGVTGSASPRGPVAEVGRLRLTRELDRVPPGGIALVVAPAGSGKSVLLSQWVGSLLTPACRVQVAPAHDDPVIFARDLTAAIELATPGFDSRVSDSVTAGSKNINVVVEPSLFETERQIIVGNPALEIDGVLERQDGAINVKAKAIRGLRLEGGVQVHSHDFH